ncbi:hypothetical protein P691DRAFT_765983 [Macrolepiota fuliginosa MF-IS2]|uniref:Uncharacterized protein n=1 Tax=Macrolepiota fuliginosa MF-IS2 TaxID=1400762 RepID=A0A9P5WYY5_9AGAR|nr:hypothetical protein P691DRAFT_765983 [Macrolepiota fuliginosa MF-IS2]
MSTGTITCLVAHSQGIIIEDHPLPMDQHHSTMSTSRTASPQQATATNTSNSHIIIKELPKGLGKPEHMAFTEPKDMEEMQDKLEYFDPPADSGQGKGPGLPNGNPNGNDDPDNPSDPGDPNNNSQNNTNPPNPALIKAIDSYR